MSQLEPQLQPQARPERQQYNIAMIAACPFPSSQGTQVMIHALATALTSAGHTVHLICYGDSEYPLKEVSYIIHRTSTLTNTFRSGPSWNKPLADLSLLYTAQKVIKKFKCKLIHAHNIEALAVGIVLRCILKIPLLYHAHTAMGPELPSYFKSRLAKYLSGFLGSVIDRALPRAANAVICFDRQQQHALIANGVADKNTIIIPPGILDPRFAKVNTSKVKQLRAKLGAGPVIIYAGNPDGYQNLHLLWAAFSRLQKSTPNAILLIANHHPLSEWDDIIPSDSKGCIQYYQCKSFQDIKVAFAVADIAVSPRQISAGSPIKVLNYFAAGLPMVATKSSSFPLSKSSTCRYRLVSATPAAFAAGMLELLEAIECQKGRRGKRLAVEFANSKFCVDEQIALYEDLYCKALV